MCLKYIDETNIYECNKEYNKMKNEKMNLFENLQNMHEAEELEKKDYIKYTQLMEKAAYDDSDEMIEDEINWLANYLDTHKDNKTIPWEKIEKELGL